MANKNSIMLNIGCGEKVIDGYINIDNSLSALLSSYPLIVKGLRILKILTPEQEFYIDFCKRNKIIRADLRKGLDFDDNTVDVIYSSHTFEHLDKLSASNFLKDARRVLKPKTGSLRLIVPSMAHLVREYQKNKDCDEFIKLSVMATPVPKNFIEKIIQLFFGFRHHLWMYDEISLTKLLSEHGYKSINVVKSGQTTLKNLGNLNLKERAEESVIIEALAN